MSSPVGLIVMSILQLVFGFNFLDDEMTEDEILECKNMLDDYISKHEA